MLVIHAKDPGDLVAINGLVRQIDQPRAQFEIESVIIRSLKDFSPEKDLGCVMKPFSIGRGRKGNVQYTSIRLPVLRRGISFSEMSRVQPLWEKVSLTPGPKIISLQGEKSGFRIAREASPPESFIFRVRPEIGRNHSRIQLKDLSIEWVGIQEKPIKLFYDIELVNGEAVLLTAPELKGRYLMVSTCLMD